MGEAISTLATAGTPGISPYDSIIRPPPPTMLDTPWRKTKPWNVQLRNELLEEVRTFQPSNLNHSKIILLGPVGAGKSSLVNTVASVMSGRVVTSRAQTGSEDESLTRTYREYPVETNTRQTLKFLLCDTKGIEDAFGFVDNEFEYILEGNMPNKYQFSETLQLSPNHNDFRHSPNLGDKAHCVCFVFDGSTVGSLGSDMVSKFKTFVAMMHRKGIPHVVLLSKIDMIDPELMNNMTMVYRSIKIKRIVDKVSGLLGVPRNLIMPMKNYESEHMLDTNIDILALLSLTQMLHATEDFLYNSIT